MDLPAIDDVEARRESGWGDATSAGRRFREDIRLIVWDLDETFWRGTLTEGGIAYVDAHHDLVVALAERGIMSTICSMNDHDRVEQLLRDNGIWDFFVFPSIDWTPKAARIRSQIERIGLRAPTVLFIDDNPHNLHQAAALVEGLNIADERIVRALADHPQLKGKADPDMTRLAQYKSLESKWTDQRQAGDDNIDFLRASEVRVYFEYDVEKHIDRVIELVSRTNQLNFTKLRLPEDPDEAKRELLPLIRHSGTTAGLVRVVDKYGDYGFVGFYAMTEVSRNYRLKHFCFSCRTLNMYVEHFVYDFIGRPALDVVGEVLSDVQSNDIKVDWIEALPIDRLTTGAADAVMKIESIYARGGCDLMSLMHYFSLNCKHITEEFNILKNHQSLRLDHSCFLLNALRGLGDEELSAAETLGYDREDFTTSFPDPSNAPQVYLLSFWADADIPYYRHRATGLELPYFLIGSGKEDLITDDALIDRLGTSDIQRNRIACLRDGWDYHYGFSRDEMVARYRSVLDRVPRTSRVFMTLANDRHPPYFHDPVGWPPDANHRLYNSALADLAKEFDNVVLVDFGRYVEKADDVLDINHLRRDLYFKIYEEIMAALRHSSHATN